MFEVDVNRLVTDFDPAEISGSVAERGANAGPETWANALAAGAAPPPLLSPDQYDAVRAWARGFGAWDAEHIASWSPEELCALVLQYAAGDYRELLDLAPGDGVADVDWSEATALADEGTLGGNLFPHEGRLWITLE